MFQKGKVAQVIGPVVDVEFASDKQLPRIYDSLEITKPDGTKLILEVQSHIGEDVVRAISMDSTEGLSRDTEVIATGSPIKMPVGQDIYGRLFNVIGDGVDGLGDLPKDGDNGLPIHREAPKFEELSTTTEVLFTGIKVIDLIEPRYAEIHAPFAQTQNPALQRQLRLPPVFDGYGQRVEPINIIKVV